MKIKTFLAISLTLTPVKFTITRDGQTLFFQPPGGSAVPLEATAQDKFKIDNGTPAAS